MNTNDFLNATMSHDALTENGAISHSTSGKFSLDYFAKAGTYRNRTEAEVSASISAVWSEDPLLALRMIFYLVLNPKILSSNGILLKSL